jgi:alpha-mannosidase
LVVVPPCAESILSKSWVKTAEEAGAIFIRDVEDRDEILRVAFEKLGIDATIGDEESETFLSLGLCCFLEELLTRKLRYMSNLDTQNFELRVVDAAKAHQAGNVEERETNLQKAFDLLTQAKEYFFPTATKLLELTWVEEEDLATALPDALRLQRRRGEKSNVVLPVPLLKICRERYPETFALLKEEVEAKRTILIGGDEWEGPLYLQSPLEIVRTLLAGRAAYLDAFGTAPKIFARREAGYAQILPQLLKLTGYEAAFARTGDGWTLLEQPTDRSRFLWQGRDGSTVAAFCKKPLDAAESEEILQLPERIGNSYYSDDATSVVFERRPGKGSRWLSDFFRMDRYSPVIGKFYDFNEYVEVTRGAGDKEKFVKDQFKTNFLTRSARRERPDLVSNWPRRRRLGAILSALDGLEATVREATLKAKRNDAALNSLFSAYLDASNRLSARVAATLDELDARFLVPNVETPAETSENATTQTAQTAVSR